MVPRTEKPNFRKKESGNRYTPTTCFETFPFPIATTGQEADVACAAKELDDLRCRWLNPPEWTKTEILEFPGSINGPWARMSWGRTPAASARFAGRG